jgi:hypothetical protein
MMPIKRAIRIAASTRFSGGVRLSALSIAIEMALVGPLISCLDESSRAPTPVMTMAVNNPICIGMSKMVA